VESTQWGDARLSYGESREDGSVGLRLEGKWEKRLSVCSRGLIPHLNVHVAGDVAVLSSVGEHPRGGTLDDHGIRGLGRDGELRWTIEKGLWGPVADVEGGLLMLTKDPTAFPVWEVLLVRPKDGKLRERWPLRPAGKKAESAHRSQRGQADWCLVEGGLGAQLRLWIEGEAHVTRVRIPYDDAVLRARAARTR